MKIFWRDEIQSEKRCKKRQGEFESYPIRGRGRSCGSQVQLYIGLYQTIPPNRTPLSLTGLTCFCEISTMQMKWTWSWTEAGDLQSSNMLAYIHFTVLKLSIPLVGITWTQLTHSDWRWQCGKAGDVSGHTHQTNSDLAFKTTHHVFYL